MVAVTGGSASGKSTLSARLAEHLADMRPLIILQDHYFRQWSPEEHDLRTSNSPPAVRWELLRDTLHRLSRGESTPPPPRLAADGRPDLQPGGLVLVDGHLVLWDEDIRALCHLKLFLDLPDEERVVRRLVRDVARREAGLDGAVAWYRRDVIPNHWRYTAPARWWADLVVPSNPVSETAFAVIATAVRSIAARLAAAAPEPAPAGGPPA